MICDGLGLIETVICDGLGVIETVICDSMTLYNRYLSIGIYYLSISRSVISVGVSSSMSLTKFKQTRRHLCANLRAEKDTYALRRTLTQTRRCL